MYLALVLLLSIVVSLTCTVYLLLGFIEAKDIGENTNIGKTNL
jgi:hypothetical protein